MYSFFIYHFFTFKFNLKKPGMNAFFYFKLPLRFVYQFLCEFRNIAKILQMHFFDKRWTNCFFLEANFHMIRIISTEKKHQKRNNNTNFIRHREMTEFSHKFKTFFTKDQTFVIRQTVNAFLHFDDELKFWAPLYYDTISS